MEYKKIQNILSESIKTSISLRELGRNTFQIISPFEFYDGDILVAYLEMKNDNVIFSDHGHTLMHVSYDVDINVKTRKEILENVIATHELNIENGDISAQGDISNIDKIFWDFMQGLLKISDISQWKFERAVSLFLQEFDNFMETTIKPKVPISEKEWFDPDVDPKQYYTVPWICKNDKEPIFIFPIKSNDACQQSIITTLKYKEEDYIFNSLGVFSDIDIISRKTRNQCIDNLNRVFTNFSQPNKERTEDYIISNV